MVYRDFIALFAHKFWTLFLYPKYARKFLHIPAIMFMSAGRICISVHFFLQKAESWKQIEWVTHTHTHTHLYIFCIYPYVFSKKSTWQIRIMCSIKGAGGGGSKTHTVLLILYVVWIIRWWLLRWGYSGMQRRVVWLLGVEVSEKNFSLHLSEYQNLEQCISTMDPQNIVWGSVRSRGVSTQKFWNAANDSKYLWKDKNNFKFSLKYVIYVYVRPLNTHFLENNLSVTEFRSRYFFGL